jgi:23S rRNA-/tRNA-specific pseudouridylate synthase
MLGAQMSWILADTDDYLVVNKPAGWLTIAPSSSANGQLGADGPAVPIVIEALREKFQRSPHVRILPVHRLDRETSGVLLVAKTAHFHREASQWFQSRQLKKTYECLAVGSPRLPILKIQSPIEGKPCLTQVEVIRKSPEKQAFFGKILLGTGRRHQIRIHLASLGYPLCGDVHYGGPREWQQMTFDRVALHARELRFPSGERFEAPRPADFQAWVDWLGHSV